MLTKPTTFKEHPPMSFRTHIQRAWCVELNREVTITEARREYLNLEAPPSAFTFYCHDMACRNLPNKVAITGANYRHPAEEKTKYVTAYFKSKNGHAHHTTCEWITGKNTNDGTSSEESVPTRKSKVKQTDFVEIFDPPLRHAKTKIHKASPYRSGFELPNLEFTSSTSQSKGTSEPGKVRTSDFEMLIQSYMEAKSNLSRDEFRALPLSITGKGEIGYAKFFRWIGTSKSFEFQGVVHGGAKFDRRYGAGFRLKFFDFVGGDPVYLYISANQVQNFKYARYLMNSVLEVENSGGLKYFRVFFMGEMAYSPTKKCWDVIVPNLNYLSMIVTSKQALDSTVL